MIGAAMTSDGPARRGWRNSALWARLSPASSTMRRHPVSRTDITTTMATSRKSGPPSRVGEEEFWKSWELPITIDELATKHAIPDTLTAQLRELLEQARRDFRDEEDYFTSTTSKERRDARKILRRLSQQFRRLEAEWLKASAGSPDATGLIHWYASATGSWLTRGVDAPLDYVAAFLDRSANAVDSLLTRSIQCESTQPI